MSCFGYAYVLRNYRETRLTMALYVAASAGRESNDSFEELISQRMYFSGSLIKTVCGRRRGIKDAALVRSLQLLPP